MLLDLDESLRSLLRTAPLASGSVRVEFDPPNKDWVARRTAPTLNLFLADLREDTTRRVSNYDINRDRHGVPITRQPADRLFRVAYAITAWTSKPEDDHQLLGSALQLLVANSYIPEDHCIGEIRQLFDDGKPVPISVGTPVLSDRLATELWTSIGGQYRPSLTLVAQLPVAVHRLEKTGPPQTQPPVYKFEAVTETNVEIIHGREAGADAAATGVRTRPRIDRKPASAPVAPAPAPTRRRTTRKKNA